MPSTKEVAVLIAGAGPIGLACALSAKRRGLGHLVVDAGAIANSIVRYPIGMTFFTTPERLEIGNHPLTCHGAKATREEALMYYRGVVRSSALEVRTFTRLATAARVDGAILCSLTSSAGTEQIACERLILATGYFDNANMLGVPGENLPHVSHWFDEAHRSSGQDVVIIGGRNSAVECALQCFRAGARVTMLYRGTEFRPSVKYWLRPDLENRVKAGEIAVRMGATVTAIENTSVVIQRNGEVERVPADRVYALTGYYPDFDLLGRIGIAMDPTSGKASLDPATLESNVPGVHLAGSVSAGRNITEVFIENGRFDGEKILGDSQGRARAEARYNATTRPTGE